MRRLHRFMPVFIVLGIACFLVLNVILTISIYDHRNRGRQYVKTSVYGNEGLSIAPSDKKCGETWSTVAPVDQRETKTSNKKELPVILNDNDASKSALPQHSPPAVEDKLSKRAEVQFESKQDECPVLRLKSKHARRSDKVACQPHKPSPEACVYAAKTYPFNPNLLNCKKSRTVEFCEFKRGGGVSCSFPPNCKSIEIHSTDLESGKLRINGAFSSLKSLETGLLKVLHKTAEKGLNFIFISCVLKNGTVDFPQQLLSWATPTTKMSRVGPAINLNIVLLDSVSRPHFYRSLPKVLEEFNKINSDENSGGEILDFVSFQSVHGHSAENGRALFSGSLFPPNMTDLDKQKAPVGIDLLYKQFKDAGYLTMYQDDLCWSGMWGMRMELGSPKSWKLFWKKIKDSYIDNTGLSLASCNILKSHGLRSPFGESKDHQMCFNGQFQHDYLLNYARLWHAFARRPTISYTSLNVAHDVYGMRTQTLNLGLVSHARHMIQLDKTITILFADHGNTYTPYVRKILEGRFEMYHPSFFMLVPDGVRNMLGEETMSALRGNQNRLFTMLDVNAGLRSIAELAANLQMPAKRGIFGEIPAERTCNHLPLKLPNLCVCEGWDNVATNDTTQVSVLEFAVGYLNSEIDGQWRHYKESILESDFAASEKLHATQQCHHLVPLRFLNVRERNAGNTLITSLDFVVAAGEGANHNEDVFHVETQSSIRPGVKDSYMKVLSFDRLSPYATYQACSDKGVKLSLCVCSLKSRTKASELPSRQVSVANLWQYMPNLADISSKKTLFNKKKDKCIYIVARDYFTTSSNGKIDTESVVVAALQGLNICPKESFMVKMRLSPYLMKVSGKKTFSTVVHGNSLVLLTVLATENLSWTSNYKFEYDVLPLW